QRASRAILPPAREAPWRLTPARERRPTMAGSIMSICSCLDPATGKPYPKGQCPRWNQRGHRKWYGVIDQDRIWDGQRWKRDQLRSPRFGTRLQAERWLEGELPAIRAHTAPSVADRAMTEGAVCARIAEIGRAHVWTPV